MFQFIGSVFNALIARPIFNLLIIIIALLPGHNLGVAIIIFTIIVRLALYPLLKKQLHHTMAMRKLQPEIKKIKKQAAGDKQKEYALMMELYKEREIKPLASIGILFAQIPILLALFFAINTIINEPEKIITNAYWWVAELPFIQELATDINKLNYVFLGFIDLSKPAIESGTLYLPAMILVIASVASQFYQSKQLLMTDKDARGLRQILKDSSQGKEVDQTEIQAATSKFTLYIIPFMLFVVAINLASALSLYWLVGSLVAIFQQRRILRKDVSEMESTPDTDQVKVKKMSSGTVKTYIKQENDQPDQEIISTKNSKTKNKSGKKRTKGKKRR
ncbi:MAG: YidC/Oxa1 family membrane protein insertase [Patescibacteria group bacterium]|jgi:YidC/Oxa1 family membrane protein insertase|nr:YidC/Oxa1 family membrane protein insertase [Patescibacteria group bacterium]